MRNPMSFFLILLAIAFTTQAKSQGNPMDCVGAGCCCNAQANGNWNDCADPLTECRRQTGAPYLQICTSKSESPAIIAPLKSSQPAQCELTNDTNDAEDNASECVGAGCCCNVQAGGNWPSCADPKFECRRQTGAPFLQVCVRKGSPANAPVQLSSNEPAHCRKVADAIPPRRKPTRKKGLPPTPGDIIDTRGDGVLFDYQVTEEDLIGCGMGDARYRVVSSGDEQKSSKDPEGLIGRGWDQMAIDLPCAGLQGGKVVKFQSFCEQFRDGSQVRIDPNGLPHCWDGKSRWPPQEETLKSGWCVRGLCLRGMCTLAYLGGSLRPSFAKQSKFSQSTVPLIKYKTGSLNAECFYMRRDDWSALLSATDTKTEPREAKKKTLPDPATLSDEDLKKEILANGTAIKTVAKELAETRKNAQYPDIDVEPLKQEIKAKYAKKKIAIDAQKKKLGTDCNEERDRRGIASPCASEDGGRKMELRRKYGEPIKRLDDELNDYKDNLNNQLILKHGDAKSRKVIKKLGPELKSLKNRRARLEIEDAKRWKDAEERGAKLRPLTDETDGPLIPEDDPSNSNER